MGIKHLEHSSGLMLVILEKASAREAVAESGRRSSDVLPGGLDFKL